MRFTVSLTLMNRNHKRRGTTAIDPRWDDVFSKTRELYRQRRPSSSVLQGWLDDELWMECAAEARIKIMGDD